MNNDAQSHRRRKRRYVAVASVAVMVSSGIVTANVALAEDCGDDPLRPPNQPSCIVNLVSINAVNETHEAVTFTTPHVRLRLSAWNHRVIDQAVGQIVATAQAEGSLATGPIAVNVPVTPNSTICNVTAAEIQALNGNPILSISSTCDR